MALVLHGYRFSVYTRIARMGLAERGLAWSDREVDPFADPAALAGLHPFARVPVLDHDGFVLHETAAILRYLDAAFAGPPLVPADPKAAARMAQAIGIADAYGYWPMVRQVFSHAVFRPADGRPGDPLVIAEGLRGSAPVLAALEAIAAEGRVFSGEVTLADLHLAPMVACFAAAEAGAAALAAHPALAAWFARVSVRDSFGATAPGLPSGEGAVAEPA